MEKSNGLGLQNIYNRIFLINGKLQYESTIGEGTICNLEIPIKLNCVKSNN
jgi:signal transduction histidine kinase